MYTNPNEPVLPVDNLPGTHLSAIGLTKREFFASQALQWVMAANLSDGDFTDVARQAVHYADTLIAALNKAK